jgi:hypothetical protein
MAIYNITEEKQTHADAKTNLKIGVLTFHRCINYGSYWQARCLVEGLRALGHDAVILDHDSRRINLAEWKCAYRPVLPTVVPQSDYPLYREKITRFFQAFETLPFSRRFQIENPTKMESCDLVVVGSDEVWNLFHPWYGNRTLFFGDGIKAQRLISYASSFGNYPCSWGLAEEWSNRLRNFEAISVRDLNSQIMIKNEVGFEPDLVLDPSIQFPLEPEESDYKIYNKPYIAVYGHNFSDYFIREIRSLSNESKLPLISIGYRNDWVDEQWITAGPHEFARFIAHAKSVVTNFFHGCVFALRYQKPFVCETSPYRSNKLEGLMLKIGAEKHFITQETPTAAYKNCLSTPLDIQILERIEKLRRSSNEYLDRAMFVNQLKVA